MMKLPKTHWPDKSESGSYRVNPYSTLAGERSTALSPGFGLPTAKGDDGVGGDDASGGGSFADDGGTLGAIDVHVQSKTPRAGFICAAGYSRQRPSL